MPFVHSMRTAGHTVEQSPTQRVSHRPAQCQSLEKFPLIVRKGLPECRIRIAFMANTVLTADSIKPSVICSSSAGVPQDMAKVLRVKGMPSVKWQMA